MIYTKPVIDVTIPSSRPIISAEIPKVGAITDYNRLKNKPQINGVELMGNILFEDFFLDGLIIDGGTAGVI